MIRSILTTGAVAAVTLALGGCQLLSTPDPVQLYRFGAMMDAPAQAGQTPAPLLVSIRRIEFPDASKDDRILGVTIAGDHAGDLIAEFVLAMKHGMGLNKILGTIHIYPTWAEANKAVAGTWRRAHVNPRLLALVERYHRWRRG